MNVIAFGPVPSRRLGQSLGINNIPPKICTYSCVYCQVGRTLKYQIEREAFYQPKRTLGDVEKKVKEATSRGEPIDYLAFVPDGEPTLDLNLGKEIQLLKSLGIRIAVITNGSLVWREEVRDDLSKADWVCLKIDAVSDDIWRRINRNHKSLQLEKILEGMSEFAHTFRGELTTETMLVQGINDSREELENVSDFIAQLGSGKSYVAIPTRPPAEKRVQPASEHTVNMAYQIFDQKSIDVEYLIGYEGNAFAFTGNVEEDLLSITSVHPMREDGVSEFLAKAEADWAVVEKLISEQKLLAVGYEGKRFYTRRLPTLKKSNE